MRRVVALLVLSALVVPLVADTKLQVTVIEKKTGEPVTDLKANDFRFLIGKAPRQVTACRFKTGVVDVVMMLDSSLMGQQISSLAPSLIGKLGAKEEMALVAYDNSANLIQEFTSSKMLLGKALREVQFGNSPRLMDALYAVAADGFAGSTFRRVILLLTTGVDGPSSVKDTDIIRLCRREGISIYPVHMMNYGRHQLEKLARLTGGSAFDARKISKTSEDPAALIFGVMRGHYEITLTGNLPLGDSARIEVKGERKKYFVSYLELN